MWMLHRDVMDMSTIFTYLTGLFFRLYHLLEIPSSRPCISFLSCQSIPSGILATGVSS